MANVATYPMPSLLLQDETAWLDQTATLVSQGRFAEIDPNHLSEYLSDMARRDRREVVSRLTVLLTHLIKWEHQVERRGGPWESTILHQRHELQDLLDSRVLQSHGQEMLPTASVRAVKQAALEIGTDTSMFPAECPWSLEEIVAAQEDTA